MFIVVEGVDGVGKSTLCQALLQENINGGEESRSLIYGGLVNGFLTTDLKRALEFAKSEQLDDEHDLVKRLVFASARAVGAEHVRAFVGRPHMHMISDRYVETNAAYAYAANGVGAAKYIRDYEYRTLRAPKPDLTVVLTASPRLLRYHIEARTSAGYDSSPATRFELDTDRLKKMDDYYTKLLPTVAAVHIEQVEHGGKPRSTQELVGVIQAKIKELS